MILLFGVGASAQLTGKGITGKGLKLGFDIASIRTGISELNNYLDTKTGFTGGAFLTYNFSREIALQPEILYVSKGAKKGFFIFSVSWNVNYIEIPVLLKYGLAPNGRVRPNLFVGPAVDILTNSELSVIGVSFDVTDGMKKTDVGLVFGGGFDAKSVTFDVRYTLGMSNTVNADKVNKLTGAETGDFYYLTANPEVKNRNISFMVGVRF